MMHAELSSRRTRSSVAVTAVIVAALAVPAGAQTSGPAARSTAPATPAPTLDFSQTPAVALNLSQTPAPLPAQATSGDTLQLSMDQAVQMALQTNLGLKSNRMNLDVAAQAIAAARSAFLPVVTTGVSRSNRQSQPTDFTQGNSDISSQNVQFGAALAQTLPWLGGRVSANWNANRSSQVGGFTSFNPQLGSNLQVVFTQPLFQNLFTDSARTQLRLSQRNQALADTQLQISVTTTEVQVREAYLQLVSAIQFRDVARQNLDLVNQQLRGVQARVAVGQNAPIDTIAAQAQVANFQEQFIVAESTVSSAEDVLRTQILDSSRPDYWTIHIVPTDDMQATPTDLDSAAEEAAIKNALANRLDASISRQNLEKTDIALRLDENLARPAVNLQTTYSAVGTGGTLFQFGQGFPPPVVSRVDRSFGAALDDTFLGAYPAWSVGLNVTYPVGQTAAKVAIAQDEIQRAQATTNLQALQIEIVREVRDAARGVRTAIQRMQAADAALQSSQKQADALQESVDVGLKSLFELQTVQQQLAGAKQNAVQARQAYIAALIRFDAVQKIQR